MIETIAAIAATAAVVGAFYAWTIRVTIAPLQVVIQNNTTALNSVTQKLDDHDTKLEDHGNRLVKIETVHEMEARQ